VKKSGRDENTRKEQRKNGDNRRCKKEKEKRIGRE